MKDYLSVLLLFRVEAVVIVKINLVIINYDIVDDHSPQTNECVHRDLTFEHHQQSSNWFQSYITANLLSSFEDRSYV